jgi:hypothetical protein
MQPARADRFEKILKSAAAACMMHSMHGGSDTRRTAGRGLAKQSAAFYPVNFCMNV